jgi:hypothetical protein
MKTNTELDLTHIPNLAGTTGFEPAISTLTGSHPRPLDDVPRLSLVTPAGFEPAIYTLRGCRPRPLDDGAALVPQRELVHRRNARDYSSFPQSWQINELRC